MTTANNSVFLKIAIAILLSAQILEAESPASMKMVEIEARSFQAKADQIKGALPSISEQTSPPFPAGAFRLLGIYPSTETSRILALFKDAGITSTESSRVITVDRKSAEIRNVREFLYPTEYSEPDEKGKTAPIEFESTPVGTIWKFTPTTSSEDTINLSISVNRKKLKKFIDYSQKSAPSAPVWQPCFEGSEITADLVLYADFTAIFGMVANSEATVMFVSARILAPR